jgi:hypothetical protein
VVSFGDWSNHPIDAVVSCDWLGGGLRYAQGALDALSPSNQRAVIGMEAGMDSMYLCIRVDIEFFDWWKGYGAYQIALSVPVSEFGMLCSFLIEHDRLPSDIV